MAVEKFIHGKHDEGHHEGKRSELRRIMDAEDWMILWPELVEAVKSGTLEDETCFKAVVTKEKENAVSNT